MSPSHNLGQIISNSDMNRSYQTARLMLVHCNTTVPIGGITGVVGDAMTAETDTDNA